MKWNEVKVETESEAVEAVANILMEAGATGVAIEDSLDVEHFQSDQYGEILDKNDFTSLKEGALVMAYFPETTFLPEIRSTAHGVFSFHPSSAKIPPPWIVLKP